MQKAINNVVLGAAAALILASALAAQKTEAAPIPSQVASAKKVFISNTVGDDLYSDDPAQVYDAFYAAMKSWGRYELVSTPAAADLIFEVSFRNPIAGVAVGTSDVNAPVGGSYYDPHIQLVIVDPKTRVSLWWFMARVKPPLFRDEKSVDRPITDLMGQLKPIVPKAAGVNADRNYIWQSVGTNSH
jgi:hypothetical protein